MSSPKGAPMTGQPAKQQEPKNLFEKYLQEYPQDNPYFCGIIFDPISKNVKKFMQKYPLPASDIGTSGNKVDLEKHWRDLFISDVRGSLVWDAEHGNPELFKAVRSLDSFYDKFSVEQHDQAIATKAVEEYKREISTGESACFTIHAELRAEVVEILRKAGCSCIAARVLEETMPDYHLSYIKETDEIVAQAVAKAISEDRKRPRPPCEECVYQKQAAEAREKVLKELDDLLRNPPIESRLTYESLSWVEKQIDTLRSTTNPGDTPKN
jgi:hypothetical protein